MSNNTRWDYSSTRNLLYSEWIDDILRREYYSVITINMPLYVQCDIAFNIRGEPVASRPRLKYENTEACL